MKAKEGVWQNQDFFIFLTPFDVLIAYVRVLTTMTRMLLYPYHDFNMELQKYRHDVKCIKTNPLPLVITTNISSRRLTNLLTKDVMYAPYPTPPDL